MPIAPPLPPDRTAELAALVAEQEKTSAAAVEAYQPGGVRLDDLAGDAGGLLRRLPGAAAVDLPVPVGAAARRIVHLRDWHLVPWPQFADEQRAVRPGLPDADVDRLYRELSLQVEASRRRPR